MFDVIGQMDALIKSCGSSFEGQRSLSCEIAEARHDSGRKLLADTTLNDAGNRRSCFN
jgi:hypothetical protein